MYGVNIKTGIIELICPDSDCDKLNEPIKYQLEHSQGVLLLPKFLCPTCGYELVEYKNHVETNILLNPSTPFAVAKEPSKPNFTPPFEF